jgi:hypothetical protein
MSNGPTISIPPKRVSESAAIDRDRPDSLAALLYHTGLSRTPGERMVYSDIGAMVMGLSRMDLMEKKGLKITKTFAELQQASA